jgi:hypothetical protein
MDAIESSGIAARRISSELIAAANVICSDLEGIEEKPNS